VTICKYIKFSTEQVGLNQQQAGHDSQPMAPTIGKDTVVCK
jgi:hypothetical protein